MLRYYRKWMYNKNLPGRKGLTDEFRSGVNDFLEVATSKPEYMSGEKIRCPCLKCKNCKFLNPDEVKEHLWRRGFMDDYYNWTCHGEPFYANVEQQPGTSNFNPDGTTECENNHGQLNWEQRMLYDHYHSRHVAPPEGDNNDYHSSYAEEGSSYQDPVHLNDNMNCESDDIAATTDKFFESVKVASKEPLYPGCERETQLSAVSELLSIKTDFNLSENCMDRILQFCKRITPPNDTLPDNYYQTKRLMRELGLPVIKIDSCMNGCMLYWKEAEFDEVCRFCNEPRYKYGKNKRRPQAQLHYLPLTPRLQRLYASNATASHMTWHASHEKEDGIMCHPSDSEAWKHFNRTHPDFAAEPRNIRLGLCSDGFSPHGQYGAKYSCWPVILTPYNLPPGVCMKDPYLFLSLIIPGPNDPKRLIDVYMQPLIEELKQLWVEGVQTYDVSRGEYFNMRAALLWTINDFPAYGMLSGWSTAGKLGCPICMNDSKAFYLKHSKKVSYFDCHRRFLPKGHKYRKDKKSFFKDRVEKDPPPCRLSSSDIWDQVCHMDTVVTDPIGKPNGFGKLHKWTKRSIFWELPYWKTNLLRHNLDVMHIEKNVFDNIFNTVMDVKRKSKDHLEARQDISEYCCRPELEVLSSSSNTKSKAHYTLSKDQRRKICEWVQSLRLPDGYSSKLARCVDMKELKLKGMKSHDCHVFMQKLLPIALREMLPEYVWGPITEVCLFFQTICSTVLDIQQVEELESSVSLMLCNMEKIFPPSFFDAMEHLLIHLPYEAKIAGPVQYRWMYPFERYVFVKIIYLNIQYYFVIFNYMYSYSLDFI